MFQHSIIYSTIFDISHLRGKIVLVAGSDPQPAHCPDRPPQIEHADIQYNYGNTYLEGATAGVSCRTNYQWSDGSVGTKTLTCKADGTWSALAHICFCILIFSFITNFRLPLCIKVFISKRKMENCLNLGNLETL